MNVTGHVGALPILFGKIILPAIVREELARPRASVRDWIANPPDWLEFQPPAQSRAVSPADLDDGEKAAILLATKRHTNLLLSPSF